MAFKRPHSATVRQLDCERLKAPVEMVHGDLDALASFLRLIHVLAVVVYDLLLKVCGCYRIRIACRGRNSVETGLRNPV